MSKSLKKLIDINRLREFKNKLVGTDSAYVQTGAVDQTVAGTKTFSKPIVGSVTGSSGSCTGNSATATKATQDSDGNKITTTYSKNGHTHDDRYYTENEVNNLLNGKANTSGTYSNLTVGNAGSATNATYANWLRTSSHPDYLFRAEWDGAYFWTYVNDPAGNSAPVRVTRSDSSGNADHATSADSATKATQDAAGNTITTTYATKAENNIKANNSEVVHKSGDETIAGTKTFSNEVLLTHPNALMAQNGGYTLVLRNDGSDTYILMSDKGGVPGTWNDARPLVISNSTGVCSINGNADTATKLATARTIALSGAATGTATAFDGSGNITIPVTALSPSAIRAQWYAAFPDGAEAHNAMWGGRDITTAFNNGTVSTNIANGTFRDIFPGDYITKQVTIPRVLADDGTTVLFAGGTYTVNWVIADCDYWINKGDTAPTATTVHHVVIVPQAPIFEANMNATNTAEGGYASSWVYTYAIPACATGIVNAFGSDHILTFRDSIVRAVNTSSISSGAPFWTGASSEWGWYDAQCNLMCERMVYGMPAFSSSAWDAGVATRQMSAFRLSERLINYNRNAWWLRDVVSSAHFAFVDGNGSADTSLASGVLGVRPFALLK